MKQGGFATILVLLAVVLVGGVGVGWYLSNTGVIPKFTGPATSEQPPAPPEVPESDTEETASPEPERISYKENPSWQTYTDSEAGFSVQYPGKLGSSELGKWVNFLSCINDPSRGEICLTGFNVRKYDDYDGGSRRAWLLKKYTNISTYPLSFEELIITGTKSLVVSTHDTGSNNTTFVIIPKGKTVILFSFPESRVLEAIDYQNKVLSTFRFTQ